MKIRNVFAMLFLGLLLGMYEATAMTFAKGFFLFVLPVIPVMVLLVMRERMLQAILFAGSAGVALDMLAPETGGFAFARLLLISLVIVFFAVQVLTNHSVYVALALTALARGIDRLWVAGVSWWHGWMPFGDVMQAVWSASWSIIIADACVVGVIFALTTFLLKRFVIGRLPDAERYV